ncbi:uncharacterized protein LOC111707354 [Eurytemora carolleeae]|uniref:uncharacterized protein LOC111707354 n=1 Tax=Eurytemora carolleeae TaxID=1294199 RepID=UPI000C75A5A4|nr:uncharacterized protein LOC111707354 [Eurytemora carolleeae]XP_023336218.1 uncharacterized protein LOC111707354 [Eurytemora carolleeae]|eukprot:XP_023336217.1 uncharacterized protein LOC111707354 [Eurytemora affinis]
MLGLMRSLAGLNLNCVTQTNQLRTGIRRISSLQNNLINRNILPPISSTLANSRSYFKAMDEHGRGETAAEGYGITLYNEKGARTGLKAVELRFKRLDWGMWIRTRAGRNKKAWKKNQFQLRVREKHVFVAPYHKRRFDRAVLSDIKAIRHIPDDPYKPYNDLSFQLYHSIKLKNMELIKKYGSTIHQFPWYRAHFKKNLMRSDKMTGTFYEPPGYHQDVANGDGLYTPSDRAQNTPAPSYVLEQRGVSAVHRKRERKYWKCINRGEPFYGPISQSHVLKLPVFGTSIG